MKKESESNSQISPSDIRHEINNALTGIIGYAQLLKMRGELKETELKKIINIEKLAYRIEELVKEIK
ncbi:MAG: hypothetical protein H7Z37_09200 [Pyrinomonadaceae bacterium]|nr:hypothetical protein [Pyrinomonadaceae bacterium]